ncbi:kinase, partial [Klebsiella oxytoca]
SIIFTIGGGIVCAFIVPPYYREYKRNSRLNSLREQFKDLLEALTASYSAGRNTVDAFGDAREDMVSIYGE